MSVRPLRPAGGAAVSLLLVLVAAVMGRSTGAAWLFVVAAGLGVALVPSVVLPALGAGRTRVLAAGLPSVVVAGRPVALHVRARAPRPVSVELVDRGAVVARWWQPAGDHAGSVAATFARRGVVDGLTVRVRCAAPSGLWPWRGRRRLPLAEPVRVGPAPVTTGPPPVLAAVAAEGVEYLERHGEPGEVGGVRPYTDGDPVGWVHWPTTLRTGELVVREWVPPGQPVVEVVARPGPDGDVAAGLAAGEVAAALARGHPVVLRTPTPAGPATVAVAREEDAAAPLADAPLGPVPAGARPPSPARPDDIPDDSPDDIEDGLAPRVGVAVTMAIGSGAVLGALGWPLLTTLVCAVGLPVATWVSWRNRRRSSPVVALVSVVLAVVAVARFVVALGGLDASTLGGLRDPLAELLLVLLVVHGLDLPKRRNLRFALGSSAVLLLYAGALRVDPGYGLWVVAWFAAAGWSLAALHRSSLAAAPALVAGRRLPPSARALVRTVGVVGGCAAAALAVLAVVPVPEGGVPLIYPSQLPLRLPVDTPGAIANPALAAGRGDPGTGSGGDSGGAGEASEGGTVGYYAFAESFAISGRAGLDRTVVMRVRAPAPDFWRGQTFERFDGRRWYASDDVGRFRSGPVIDLDRSDGDVAGPVPTDRFVQTVFVEEPLPNLVFAAYRPDRLYLDAGVWDRPDGALRADTTLEPGTIYTVVSQRPAVTEETLRLQGSPSSGPFQRFWQAPDAVLDLPGTTTERVRALAEEITAPHESAYDKVRAVEAWLAASVVYDLDAPPPEGVDAVDHFLFESRRGFCEHIASALVVLLRSVGIPARVAAGYTPGTWDPFAGVWVVRALNAHAWAEVWFPASGWQAFDPTAEVPLAGDSLDRGTLGGPIAAALGRGALAVGRAAIVVVPAALLVALVAGLVRRRRRHRRRPVAPVQAGFERAARRAGVVVGDTDTNPAIAERLAGQRPDAATAARRAARAVDAAAFGGAPLDAADAAVRDLTATLGR